MKAIITFLLLSVCCSSCHTLRRGDLLFHQPQNDNHITHVTQGTADHVAIYLGGDSVLEAIPHQGVTVNTLSDVLHREDGRYVSARVRGVHVEQSIANAQKYLGLPYDSVFLPGTAAIYCSELVQLSYVDRHGRLLFNTIPMSFHDDSGNITDYWQQFYDLHHMSVPEGQPGSNPSDLMKRKQVVIKKQKIMFATRAL